MDLLVLVKSLPNGLHDSELRGLAMDYAAGRMALDIDLWVGDLDDRSRREAYRSARLTLEDVAFLAIDPPSPPDLWLDPDSIRMDVSFTHPPKSETRVPEPPQGSFRAHFFLDSVNTFVHVIARSAALEWRGEERTRGGE
jgi:hypothetical protein